MERLKELRDISLFRNESGHQKRWNSFIEDAEAEIAEFAFELELKNEYEPMPLPEYLSNEEIEEILTIIR